MDTIARSVRLKRLCGRYAPKFAVCFLAVGLCTLVFAPPAHAAEWWDIVGNIGEALANWIADMAESMFNFYSECVNVFGRETFISGSFQSLFGSGWDGQSQSVWDLINAVHSTLIVPLGESILALVMLVQVVKISGRIDSTATLPAVKEIVFLAVIYVLLHWLITDSVDIMTAIFDEFNKITNAILDTQSSTVGNITIPDGSVNIGQAVLLVFIGFLLATAGIISSVIAWVMSAARAIQLYIYAAFSPIPLSLLGFEETRSMGVNFLKNFAAVCLAGVIMAFLFTIFPLVCSGTVESLGGLLNFSDNNNTPIINIMPLAAALGLPILFILGITKSGSWARDLLGG